MYVYVYTYIFICKESINCLIIDKCKKNEDILLTFNSILIFNSKSVLNFHFVLA